MKSKNEIFQFKITTKSNSKNRIQLNLKNHNSEVKLDEYDASTLGGKTQTSLDHNRWESVQPLPRLSHAFRRHTNVHNQINAEGFSRPPVVQLLCPEWRPRQRVLLPTHHPKINAIGKREQMRIGCTVIYTSPIWQSTMLPKPADQAKPQIFSI
jgi:hypothetical protein